MFLDFLGQVWRLPMMLFRRVLSNPMGMFVYGILSKWYIMVMLSVVIVTFWVFKGLEESGALAAAERTVRYGLLEVQAVAQHCTPKIMNLKKMWHCIQHTKPYVEDENARRLREALEIDLQRNLQQSQSWSEAEEKNPYDDESEGAN